LDQKSLLGALHVVLKVERVAEIAQRGFAGEKVVLCQQQLKLGCHVNSLGLVWSGSCQVINRDDDALYS
jgi:hypothetical protein